MEMWLTIAIVAALAIVAFFVGNALQLNKKYSELLSDKNVAELSARLDELKKQASDEVLETISGADIPESLRAATSCGMNIIYTIDNRDGNFNHHISVSYEGHYFAHSAGMTIASWIAYFLNVQTEKILVPRNDNGAVRHVMFALNDEEQRYFLSSAVRVVSEEQVQALWKTVMMTRKNIEENSRGLPIDTRRQ